MIKNLTPHPIVVFHDDGMTTTFPPEGPVPRAAQRDVPVGPLGAPPTRRLPKLPPPKCWRT